MCAFVEVKRGYMEWLQLVALHQRIGEVIIYRSGHQPSLMGRAFKSQISDAAELQCPPSLNWTTKIVLCLRSPGVNTKWTRNFNNMVLAELQVGAAELS